MSKGKITDKQREILEYIRDTILAKGYPPAVREICEAVHLKSTSSVHSHLETLEKNGYSGLPICIAKTQYSLSDNPALLARPEGFTVSVANVRLSAGAGFAVVLTGEIMTMPGLPKVPAATNIDVTEDGVISGLF